MKVTLIQKSTRTKTIEVSDEKYAGLDECELEECSELVDELQDKADSSGWDEVYVHEEAIFSGDPLEHHFYYKG